MSESPREKRPLDTPSASPEPVQQERIGRSGPDPALELADTCDLCHRKTQNLILHLQQVHPTVYQEMLDQLNPE